jgi:hypothetical protein
MLVYTMKCGYFERAKQVATALNRTIAALKAWSASVLLKFSIKLVVQLIDAQHHTTYSTTPDLKSNSPTHHHL